MPASRPFANSGGELSTVHAVAVRGFSLRGVQPSVELTEQSRLANEQANQ